MIKINYNIINLDINKKIYDKLIAKQGDVKSRYLLFNLNINGAAIDLTNKNVRVYAIKPDGNEVFNDLTISNAKQGSCILELTTQILAICGIVKMELVITEGQKKLSSFEFELEVIKSLNRETSIVSTNEFTALIEGLASLSEYDNYKNEIKSARGDYDQLSTRLGDTDIRISEKVNKVTYRYEPTLLNAWGNLGEGYDALKVWKDELKNVRVQGVITGGSNKLMFILPLEYRPGGHLTVPVISVNADSVWTPSTLFINALTGEVETQGVIGKSHSIDITFLAER